MENKYKLAVSVDFKETSRHSFSESLYLAKRGNLEVVIIHINTDPTKTESDFATLIGDMIKDNGEAAKLILTQINLDCNDNPQITKMIKS